jgi:cytoplasmic iron level regulating protein YaaA (DUF328/UPF0246 family)
MIVVVSPAKKLDMAAAVDVAAEQGGSVPDFGARARELASVAVALSEAELQKLMSISPQLAALNAERFANFGRQETKAAAFAFAGDTYQGLEAASLQAHELAFAQDHLRILSGLYGLLRPMDEIEPYRLEMGSRLATAKGKSLYEYWGADIAEALNAQIAKTGATALVNCASNEYFGAVDTSVLSVPVITPVFKEIKDGKAKIVSFFAKKARGAMARYIIQNEVRDIAALQNFDSGGYRFIAPDNHEGHASKAGEMLFLRDYPA